MRYAAGLPFIFLKSWILMLAGSKAIWILYRQDPVYFGPCTANDPRLFGSCTGRIQIYFGPYTANDPGLFWVLQHTGLKDSWVLACSSATCALQVGAQAPRGVGGVPYPHAVAQAPRGVGVCPTPR
jgi:hypothetical protein